MQIVVSPSLPTVILKESIAAIPVISATVLEVICISEEMFQTEKDYGITMAIAKSMLEKGLITVCEYDQFKDEMLKKYQPKLAPLIAILP